MFIQLPVLAFMVVCALLLTGMVIYLAKRVEKTELKKKVLETRFSELEFKVNSLHLESLEARLNPHLFKNILNSIQSHAYQTYYAIDKLAGVLDYVLYESKNKLVSVKDELEFAQNLIEINKVKLSPLFDLKVKQRVDETHPLYTRPMLAPLISIDLIENAFKHADLQSADSFISIVFEFKQGEFFITVSNKVSPKVPMQKRHSGIGTDTLEQRLNIIYPGMYTLDRFVEDDVYIAHLKINLTEQNAKVPIAG